jgi:isopentenyl diphosphate isomerase/L-lactate dehydrogenase-like FMN-dependent dehydrogenase
MVASMGRDIDLSEIFNVTEFEPIARERMEVSGFDFYAGASWDELTLAENEEAFRRYRLRPRVLTGNEEIDTTTSMLGRLVGLPLGIAPTAMHRLAHPDGEVATARAAADAQVVMCLSTWSNCSIEEVAEAGRGPRWMQLYVHKDRSLAEDIVKRAAESGFEAIVLTVDLATPGYRERDYRNHFTSPHEFGTVRHIPSDEIQTLIAESHDRSLSWSDTEWLASLSDLPIVIKGILTPEDAILAAEHGAAAVWVSNHGGRQLDRSPAPIDVVEEICGAVPDGCEIYLDGGVRRGLDIVTAIAKGATAVFIGRPHLYALAAGGYYGVARCIELLAEEFERAMTLLGVEKVSEIGPRHLC